MKEKTLVKVACEYHQGILHKDDVGYIDAWVIANDGRLYPVIITEHAIDLVPYTCLIPLNFPKSEFLKLKAENKTEVKNDLQEQRE